MKKHVKTYISHFGHGMDDFIPCECCSSRAVDIHHIDCRGMGGSRNKDTIENLMALCRSCHDRYGDRKHLIEWLQEIHNKKLWSKKQIEGRAEPPE